MTEQYKHWYLAKHKSGGAFTTACGLRHANDGGLVPDSSKILCEECKQHPDFAAEEHRFHITFEGNAGEYVLSCLPSRNPCQTITLL